MMATGSLEPRLCSSDRAESFSLRLSSYTSQDQDRLKNSHCPKYWVSLCEWGCTKPGWDTRPWMGQSFQGPWQGRAVGNPVIVTGTSTEFLQELKWGSGPQTGCREPLGIFKRVFMLSELRGGWSGIVRTDSSLRAWGQYSLILNSRFEKTIILQVILKLIFEKQYLCMQWICHTTLPWEQEGLNAFGDLSSPQILSSCLSHKTNTNMQQVTLWLFLSLFSFPPYL